MSFTSELVQAGVKHISKKAAKFFNQMPVDDIAGTVRAVNRHPNEFADMMKHVNNYADKGDQSGILPYVQYQNKWKNEGVEDLRNSQTLTHGINKGSANQDKLYPQYTRPDAIENLQAAGADRLSNMKRTPRTIQGPVPPQLADKTFDQSAKSYEEAVMLGTTKFVDADGVPTQIRNYGSDTAPHGRTTTVGTRKTTGRGKTREGDTRKINEMLATDPTMTTEEKKAFKKIMAEAAAEGLDGDHIIEISRVANAIRDMSPKRRAAYFKIMKDTGTRVGNHADNIQKLTKELNQVVKPAEIRAMDKALNKMNKRTKSLLDDMLGI